jgi:hypothetical protein
MRNVRNVARAERSGGVGKLGHDSRPERYAGREHAGKPRERIAGQRPAVRLACILQKLHAVVLDEPIEDSFMRLSRKIAG